MSFLFQPLSQNNIQFCLDLLNMSIPPPVPHKSVHERKFSTTNVPALTRKKLRRRKLWRRMKANEKYLSYVTGNKTAAKQVLEKKLNYEGTINLQFRELRYGCELKLRKSLVVDI